MERIMDRIIPLAFGVVFLSICVGIVAMFFFPVEIGGFIIFGGFALFALLLGMSAVMLAIFGW